MAKKFDVVIGKDVSPAVGCSSIAEEPTKAISVNFLLDCSYAMEGQGFELLQKAVVAGFEELVAQDLVGVILFGSFPSPLSEALKPAVAENLFSLQEATLRARADMGLSDSRIAIACATRLPVPASVDLVLVTGGALDGVEELIADVAARGYRLSVIRIGDAGDSNEAVSVCRLSGGRFGAILTEHDVGPTMRNMMAALRENNCVARGATCPEASDCGVCITERCAVLAPVGEAACNYVCERDQPLADGPATDIDAKWVLRGQADLDLALVAMITHLERFGYLQTSLYPKDLDLGFPDTCLDILHCLMWLTDSEQDAVRVFFTALVGTDGMRVLPQLRADIDRLLCTGERDQIIVRYASQEIRRVSRGQGFPW